VGLAKKNHNGQKIVFGFDYLVNRGLWLRGAKKMLGSEKSG